VRKLDNDGWQLQVQFEHLALEVTNGSRRVFAADSDQPPGQDARNPVGARLRKMAGARLEYFTDANGKVDRMNGYAELVDRVAGRDAKEQAAFKDLFSEIALSKYGSIFEDTVSQRVVKAGDRWSIKMNVPSNAGDLDLKINCRFKNWEQRGEHRCVHITFTGTIATLPGTDPSLLRARIEDGRISGDLWWDPALGVGVESVQKITAQLNLNQNGQAISIPFAEQTRLQLLGIDDA
ncbi:MAG TPA: DUF6263 family protein, partial [Verrucomicrobiae bacterium]|nr:DUF6263 family protein [Verrucomicrobiae bacterium]